MSVLANWITRLWAERTFLVKRAFAWLGHQIKSGWARLEPKVFWGSLVGVLVGCILGTIVTRWLATPERRNLADADPDAEQLGAPADDPDLEQRLAAIERALFRLSV